MKGSYLWVSKEVFDWLFTKAVKIKETLGLESRPSFNKTLLAIKKEVEGQ